MSKAGEKIVVVLLKYVYLEILGYLNWHIVTWKGDRCSILATEVLKSWILEILRQYDDDDDT